MFYAVVLAGGSGTRFWPLSRRERPKQLLSVLDAERSLIRLTIDRLEAQFDPEQILIITNQEQLEAIRSELNLPEENLLAEPVGRNTAAAAGLAALEIERRSGRDSIMAILPSDHHIHDADRFFAALGSARRAAENGYLTTIGIEPRYPETGYGYIEVGQPLLDALDPEVYRAHRFIEKPDLETAKEYVASGRFLWNGGMFIWSVPSFREAVAAQMPQLNVALEASSGGNQALIATYQDLDSISIDYGIMEGAPKVAVVRGDFGWSDVGSWSALAELLPEDEHGNVERGEILSLDCHGSLFYGEDALVAAIGMDDVVVVAAGGAVLVCHKSRAQEVRQIVDQLKAKGLDDHI